MGRAIRPVVPVAGAGGEAADGVDGGGLLRLLFAERRQNAGQTAGQHALAGAGGAPENHGVAVPRQDRFSQGLVRPQDMLLADVLLEGLRPHPGRKRTKVRGEIQG